jgi:hypothetical protein
MAEQTTVTHAAGYTPIDQRSADFGKAQDDRTNYQKHQGDDFRPVMPPPPSAKDLEITRLEKLVADEKRDKALHNLSPAEKHLYLLREQQAEEQQAADAKSEARKAQTEWNSKVSDKLSHLKQIRQYMTENEGFRASQVIEVDRAIAQLSAVGSDERTGEKMYGKVTTLFDTIADEIETRERAAIMGAQNRLEQLQSRRTARPQPPEPVLTHEEQLFKAHYAEVQEAKAAGDTDLVHKLRNDYWSGKIERDKAAREAGNAEISQ